MACFSPLEAFRKPGQKQLIFNGTAQQYGVPLKIPCGQCIGCKLERSRQWAMRCVHESQLSADNMFITLTYDDAHLHPNHSLVPQHLTDFHKRLHNRLLRSRGQGIRYFACGEYGESTRRPHYHTLIFNYWFPDARHHGTSKSGERLYVSSELTSLWPYGYSNFGTVTFESAAYVARYCVKKLDGILIMSDRVPEYGVMSRRPGIGAEWYAKYRKQTVDHDSVVLRNREMQPPKFYDKKLEAVDKATFDRVKKRRSRKKRNLNEQTRERLRVREKVKQAQVNLYKREPT